MSKDVLFSTDALSKSSVVLISLGPGILVSDVFESLTLGESLHDVAVGVICLPFGGI